MIIDQSTAFIKLGKDGAPNEYPVYMSQIRRENPDWSFTNVLDRDLMLQLGYDIVLTTERPTGDVVTEGTPVLDGEDWKQTWVSRDNNTEETRAILNARKAMLKEEIDQKLKDSIDIGFAYTFQGSNGPVIGHIQLRDSDQGKLAGIAAKADRLIAKGETGAVQPLRVYEDVIYMLTPQQARRVTDLSYDAVLAMMQPAWALKDQVTAATTLAQLPTVPDSFDLPEGWAEAQEA